MLTLEELKTYASRRALSLRDIEAYCNVTYQYIGMIFKGDKPLTQEAHDEIVKGINRAHFAKVNGTFERPALDSNKNPVKRSKKKQ